MVPADSHRVPRAPRYSGYRYASRNYGYGAVILCGAAFQRLPLDTQVQSPGPTTPARPTRDTHRFGLFPVRSPLLGESLLFSLPTGTKMFQFPAFASVIDGWHAFSMPGCPIRISADQGSFAPPRGFSQLITSFVACKSLGIHRAPFLAFFSLPPTPSQRKGGGSRIY